MKSASTKPRALTLDEIERGWAETDPTIFTYARASGPDVADGQVKRQFKKVWGCVSWSDHVRAVLARAGL